MTYIQCCEDGWGHALNIGNSQTHTTLLFMPRPVVCVCVCFVYHSVVWLSVSSMICISGFSIIVTEQWSLCHMWPLPAADRPKWYSPAGQCQTPYTRAVITSINQSINLFQFASLYIVILNNYYDYTYMTQTGVLPKIINICLVVQHININIQTHTCMTTFPHHTIPAHDRRIYIRHTQVIWTNNEVRENYTISFHVYQ